MIEKFKAGGTGNAITQALYNSVRTFGSEHYYKIEARWKTTETHRQLTFDGIDRRKTHTKVASCSISGTPSQLRDDLQALLPSQVDEFQAHIKLQELHWEVEDKQKEVPEEMDLDIEARVAAALEVEEAVRKVMPERSAATRTM